MKKNSGRKKNVIVGLVLAVTVMIATALLLLKVFHMRDSFMQEEYKIIAAQIHDVTKAAVDKPIVVSLTMAADGFLKDVLEREEDYPEEEIISLISDYLTGIKDAMRAQTAFVISEKSRRYYTYAGLNKVIDPEADEHDIWYTIFVNSRKNFDIDVDTDQVNDNTWTVFVNARIEDGNNRLLGVCGVGFTMDELQAILKEVESAYPIKVNFVNSDGLVQVDTDEVNIDSAYLYDLQYGKEKDGYTYRNSEGEHVVMRYVDNLNWYMVLRGESAKVETKEVVQIVLVGAFIILLNLFMICSQKEKE